MREGSRSSSAVYAGLVALAVVSIATLFYARRSRSGSRKGQASSSPPSSPTATTGRNHDPSEGSTKSACSSTGMHPPHESTTPDNSSPCGMEAWDVRIFRVVARDNNAAAPVAESEAELEPPPIGAEPTSASNPSDLRQQATSLSSSSARQKYGDGDLHLHPFLTEGDRRAWENPLVLGFNKQRARPTLAGFSSVAQARCVCATWRILLGCTYMQYYPGIVHGTNGDTTDIEQLIRRRTPRYNISVTVCSTEGYCC